MNKTRLITVYITSHERPDSLIRAVDSVLNQSYSNFELIIVDDFSKSFDIHNLLNEYKDHPKVRIFRNGSKKGANHSRNLALDNAQGEYITGLDDDDFFHKDRLKIMSNIFEKENYSAISTISSYYDKNTNFLLFKIKNLLKNYVIPNREISFTDMKTCNYMSNQIFTKVSNLKAIGGFNESFPSLQDYDAWYRLIKKYGTALKLGKVLYHCEVSTDSITNNSGRKLQGHRYFYRVHASDFSPKDRQSFRINIELKKYGRVTYRTLFRNLNEKNLTRVLYLLVFKSCLIPKKK